MSQEVSTLRLYLLRVLYLLNFALLGLDVWPVIFTHAGVWDPANPRKAIPDGRTPTAKIVRQG